MMERTEETKQKETMEGEKRKKEEERRRNDGEKKSEERIEEERNLIWSRKGSRKGFRK